MVAPRDIIGYSLVYGLEYSLVRTVVIVIVLVGAGGGDSRLLFKPSYATRFTVEVLIVSLLLLYPCSLAFYTHTF